MRTIFKTLYSWKLATLLAFVFFFALNQCYAQDRTLQWDENTDPDLDGYKFYYGLESRYPNNPAPYDPNCQNYAGAEYSIDGGNTWNPIICPPPIVVGSGVTEIMFQGLADDKVHFFAVTAYDIDSLESGYSNEEATLCISWPTGGFYVNDEPGSPNYSSPYTIRGRADKDSQITLSDEDGNSWTVSADSDRDWSKDLDFKALYASDRTVKFTVESNGIIAPEVVATYDPTDPTSTAGSSAIGSSYISITWTASDATSGVASTELWCKPPTSGTWASTGLSQGGASGTFYYYPTQGDGEYFFATRSVDRAGNWEAGPNSDGDTSTQYIAPITITGKEGGGGGCFIDTAAPDLVSGQ